jgi:ABC-type transport system involved in cytochrome c biogenesis permease component
VKTLLQKDFRNARFILWPALWLGVPLLLILQFSIDRFSFESIPWKTAYWITFFFSSTALFYRSFAQEHRFQTFSLYLAFKTPRWQILLSQMLTHIGLLFLLSLFYLLLILIFWSPRELPWVHLLMVSVFVSCALAPFGTLLGLMLQIEREFLFSIFFMPLSTPLVLAAYGLSEGWSWNWMSLVLSFLVIGSFLSFFLFEFFFDELI